MWHGFLGIPSPFDYIPGEMPKSRWGWFSFHQKLNVGSWLISFRCYPICVETATKFGSQKAELNVSLAAVGLLWNLSDYFFQVRI